MIDRIELLAKYPEYCARAKALRLRLNASGKSDDDTLIEQYALSRAPMDGMPVAKGGMGSKTERLAFNLDHLRRQDEKELEDRVQAWIQELRCILVYIALYEIACTSLTVEEQAFVRLHFQQRIPMSRMSEPEEKLPEEFPQGFSVGKLKRMKRGILDKVGKAISQESMFL